MSSQLYNDIKTIEALTKISEGFEWLLLGGAPDADMQAIWGTHARMTLLDQAQAFERMRENIWRRVDPTLFYQHTCDHCMTIIEDPTTHVCEGL